MEHSYHIASWSTGQLSVELFSGTVLNMLKHIFERKHRESSRNFSSIVNKWSLVIDSALCHLRADQYRATEQPYIYVAECCYHTGNWSTGQLYLYCG